MCSNAGERWCEKSYTSRCRNGTRSGWGDNGDGSTTKTCAVRHSVLLRTTRMRWNERRVFHEPVPSTQSTLIYATSQPKPRSRTPFWEDNKDCGQFSGERWWGKLFAGRTRGHRGRSEIQHGIILITNATSPCVVSQPLGKTAEILFPYIAKRLRKLTGSLARRIGTGKDDRALARTGN